jgi:hypothetical protein
MGVIGGWLFLTVPPRFARDRFTTYDDVQELLTFLTDALPPGLNSSAWPDWISAHDRAIRARLQRGDQDTIVNWLMFGTSFTKAARALFELPPTSKDFPDLISRRTSDLIAALKAPHPDDRILFARRVLSDQGYAFDTPKDRATLTRHFHDEVDRVLSERQQYAEREESFKAGDFADQMMVQSRLFRDRGLSLDTSILPGFALEQALESMKNQGLLLPNSIRRVAVIGPGLDFADKNSGYDFYPVQTLQPFSTIDTLLRLGLAGAPGEIHLTTLDISPSVGDHISRIAARAKTGVSYVLELPLDLRYPWTPSLVSYWKQMGDRIGSEAAQRKKAHEPGSGVQVRAIEVRSQVAASITAEDLNVVTERWAKPPFDLVIATNVLVYYDKLDQSLAFAAIESMVRPGGFFLTNNAIVELPVSRLRSLGFVTVHHSAEISDHIFWYRRNE